MGVAVCRFYFDDAFANFENRNVVSTTAKVEYRDRFILLFIEAVGERRCRWFVDNTHDFETRDLPSVFRRLSLRVIEVCRYRDYRLLDFLAEIVFGRLFHLLKNHG